MRKQICRLILFSSLVACAAFTQTPTGGIGGAVRDETGSLVAAARVRVRSAETGLSRSLSAAGDGSYSVPALPAGLYEMKAEAPGFATLLRQATVEAGSTTTV